MKRALQAGGDNALNIYLTTAGVYLGWAYYPNQTEHNGSAYLDGIVVDWESMLGTSTTVRGPLRPGRDRHARGRPLAQPRAHVRGRLQPLGRLRGRHPADARRRRTAARRARTLAASRVSIRSTTTWTTRTTRATRSSRGARPCAHRTHGCATALASRVRPAPFRGPGRPGPRRFRGDEPKRSPTRLGGFEPPTSRSGGARSIP